MWCDGRVAREREILTEYGIENPRVDGSIPSQATNLKAQLFSVGLFLCPKPRIYGLFQPSYVCFNPLRVPIETGFSTLNSPQFPKNIQNWEQATHAEVHRNQGVIGVSSRERFVNYFASNQMSRARSVSLKSRITFLFFLFKNFALCCHFLPSEWRCQCQPYQLKVSWREACAELNELPLTAEVWGILNEWKSARAVG